MAQKTKNCVTGGMIAALLAMAALPTFAAGTWGPLGSGISGTQVKYLHVWDGKLLAAGTFASAGGLPAYNIAAWDGVQWTALDDGWDTVGGIATHNGQLAVFGLRPDSTETEIALWNGSTWTTLVKSDYKLLASYNGRLYQWSWDGFDPTGQVSSSSLWEYDGTMWTRARSWMASNADGISYVDVLKYLNGELYVYVEPFGQLYSFDGSTWTSRGNTNAGVGVGVVWADSRLYAAGHASSGYAIVSRWDNPYWGPILLDIYCQGLKAMIELDGKVIIAANFGGQCRIPHSVLRGGGGAWSPVGGDMNADVNALANYNGKLVAAGNFTEADGASTLLIAEYLGPATPVTISKFRAHIVPYGVNLNWEISADEPFDGFSVYRSENGGEEKLVNAILSSDTRSYTDHAVSPGTTYRYALVATGGSSGEVRSQTIEVTLPAPTASLYQNIPNPFNPETTIRFDVATQGNVAIDIYAPDGKRIRSLVDAAYAPGEWSTIWDGTDDLGNRVASGVYYYRMRAGKTDQARKMVLLK